VATDRIATQENPAPRRRLRLRAERVVQNDASLAGSMFREKNAVFRNWNLGIGDLAMVCRLRTRMPQPRPGLSAFIFEFALKGGAAPFPEIGRPPPATSNRLAH
jgi:hypothetical protein